MEQEQFAGYTNEQLVAMRDDLARQNSKVLRTVSFLGLAFAAAFLALLPTVEFSVLIVAPPVFLLISFVILARSFSIGARRAAVVLELESRGADVGTPVSPVTGDLDPTYAIPARNEIDSAALRKLRLPGIGAAASMLVLLSLVAVIVVSDVPDGSWLFTAAFLMFVPFGVFLVWAVVVLVSIGQIKR